MKLDGAEWLMLIAALLAVIAGVLVLQLPPAPDYVGEFMRGLHEGLEASR